MRASLFAEPVVSWN